MTMTTVLDGLTFPEGPRWHGGRLWFSDFYSERVLALGKSGAETIVRVPGRPSGLGWARDGSLLVISMLEQLASVADLIEWHVGRGEDVY